MKPTFSGPTHGKNNPITRGLTQCLTIVVLLCPASIALADSLADQLMANLMEKHLPERVYEKGNNPWPGGAYKLEVFKHGKPRVTSGPSHIHVQMPLRIVIVGNASSELLRFSLACTTSFVTTGEVNFTPVAGSPNTLKSEMTLPIPPVMANCDSMQLPIESYLRTVVTQNKRSWELRIDQEVNAWLAQ